MPEKFTFDSAFQHFYKTKGPSGFMWKYLLTYSLVMGALFALFYVPLFSSMFSLMFRDILNDGSMTESELNSEVLQLMLTFAWVIPLFMIAYFVTYSIFEASALRRYLRQEGFSLKFGADELRIMAVLLMWSGCLLLAYLLLGVGVLAIMAPVILSGDAGNVSVLGLIPLLMLAVLLPMLFFGVRLSPATAITMRDRKITFFSAFPVTKGRFWPLLGAFLVVYLIVYAIQMAGQFIAMIPMVGGMMSALSSADPEDPAAVMAMFSNPLVLIALAVLMIVNTVSMAFAHFGFLGVTSKAALTDPNWVNPSTADVFT